MLTYLPDGTQANGDHSCPVQRYVEEFTSHQLDLRRPTVHMNLALKSERSARATLGHLSSGAYYLESSKPTHLLYFQPQLFSCCNPYGVAAVPATWVTLLLPGKECERDKKCQKSNMSRQPVQTTLRRLKTNAEDSQSHIKIYAVSRN